MNPGGDANSGCLMVRSAPAARIAVRRASRTIWHASLLQNLIGDADFVPRGPPQAGVSKDAVTSALPLSVTMRSHRG